VRDGPTTKYAFTGRPEPFDNRLLAPVRVDGAPKRILRDFYTFAIRT
jgi:hypothetical protein